MYQSFISSATHLNMHQATCVACSPWAVTATPYGPFTGQNKESDDENRAHCLIPYSHSLKFCSESKTSHKDSSMHFFFDLGKELSPDQKSNLMALSRLNFPANEVSEVFFFF